MKKKKKKETKTSFIAQLGSSVKSWSLDWVENLIELIELFDVSANISMISYFFFELS